MRRRHFLGAIAAGAAACSDPEPPAVEETEPEAVGIIDTHIHPFDTERPEGVPWPPESDPVKHQRTLPPRFRETTAGLDVKGAIAVEASPWDTDNEWLLEAAASDPIMVGVVGNLEPGTEAFAGRLETLAEHPLFLGIRWGNLWGRDFHAGVRSEAHVADIRRLASAGLVMDTANPTVEMLEDLLVLTDAVPDLRVVIDHLPKLFPPPEEQQRFTDALEKISVRPQIAVKVSALLRRGEGYELATYREKLDQMWAVFGEDRVLYGSDWPNSLPLGDYGQVLGIVQQYFSEKTPAQQAKYFRENSKRIYRWAPRPSNG